MEIARKVTKELTEADITRLSSVINEALYGGREDVDCVAKMYFSYDGHNFIAYEDNTIIGLSQIRRLDKSNAAHFTVSALEKEFRKKGIILDTIDMAIEYSKWTNIEYMGLTVGNPYAINLFHLRGFELPTEMGNQRYRLLRKAKDMLREENGSDMGISESFVIPHKNFNYPDLAETEDAFDADVNEFVKKCLKDGDRLFMIRDLQYTTA